MDDRSTVENLTENLAGNLTKNLTGNLTGELNVVKFSGYRDNVQYPVLKQVSAYWQALRKGRDVPMRSDVDPRGIERALEYAFILERIAPGLARFRIAGQHLSDLMGMEVRGMPFTSFFTPVARRSVSTALERLFDGPEVAEITLSAERSMGKPALDGKVLLLPLRSDLGDVSRILGCLVTHGPIGRTPRRFDLGTLNMTNMKTEQTHCVTPPEVQPGVAQSGVAQSGVGQSGVGQRGLTETTRRSHTPRAGALPGSAPNTATKRPSLKLVKPEE